MGKYYRNAYLTLMNFYKYQGGWRWTEKLNIDIRKRKIIKVREKTIQRYFYLWENIIEMHTLDL